MGTLEVLLIVTVPCALLAVFLAPYLDRGYKLWMHVLLFTVAGPALIPYLIAHGFRVYMIDWYRYRDRCRARRHRES